MKNGKYIDQYGTQRWWKDDKLHREDEPAIIYPSGTKFWFINDKRHRKDGPAFINSDGTQMWYKDGEFHREDGPAIVYPSGRQYWYKDGKNVTDDIINWAKDRDIDLNNMSDDDKIILKIELNMWK